MATTEQQGFVGTSQLRKEDPELITGRGTYVDNISLPGMLWVGLVRSPFAHAKINSIDVSKAMSSTASSPRTPVPTSSSPGRSSWPGRSTTTSRSRSTTR